MGLSISNMVSLSHPDSFIPLGKLREFMDATADMGDNTKVNVQVRVDNNLNVQDITLGASYGDVDDRIY
jgi:hypothetical protein